MSERTYSTGFGIGSLRQRADSLGEDRDAVAAGAEWGFSAVVDTVVTSTCCLDAGTQDTCSMESLMIVGLAFVEGRSKNS